MGTLYLQGITANATIRNANISNLKIYADTNSKLDLKNLVQGTQSTETINPGTYTAELIDVKFTNLNLYTKSNSKVNITDSIVGNIGVYGSEEVILKNTTMTTLSIGVQPEACNLSLTTIDVNVTTQFRYDPRCNTNITIDGLKRGSANNLYAESTTTPVKINLTNTYLYDTRMYITENSAPTIKNSEFTIITAQDNSNNIIENTKITTFSISGNSKTQAEKLNITNSLNLQGGKLQIKDSQINLFNLQSGTTSNITFEKPRSTVTTFSANPGIYIITGYVYMPDTVPSDIGTATIKRYYPIQVNLTSGPPASGRTVEIRNGMTTITSGITDATGLTTVNLTYVNATKNNMYDIHIAENSDTGVDIGLMSDTEIELNLSDTDNDGKGNYEDKLWFTETQATITGISAFDIKLDGNTNINGATANESQLVEFLNSTQTFFNMTYPFNTSILDLRNLSVKRYESGGTLYYGIDAKGMIQGITTTLIVEELLNVQQICIKTADNDNQAEISNTCDGTEEHDLSACIISPTTVDGIQCEKTGGYFYITGTNVLGAEQFEQAGGPGEIEIPEFTTAGLIIAIIAILSITLIIRKRKQK